LREREEGTPHRLRVATLVGWPDDRPFESRQALTDFVGEFADVGVTDFMFGLSAARETLEQSASILNSLRAVAWAGAQLDQVG
jgi:hypothetical protein